MAIGAVLACALVVGLGALRNHRLEDILMVALSQMVSLVPEGLPVAVTIALAVGMQRMAGQGALVRRLAAVETIGEATVVCTDKTGTLTNNEMTVQRAWVPFGKMFQIEGTGYSPRGAVLDRDGHPAGDNPDLRALAEGGLLCSDARLVAPENPQGDWSVDGDPTEGALVTFAAKLGLDP
ncbi:MAG: HAD-IC family P-type ATPase, partial [Armatimonadaceae bacterium]